MALILSTKQGERRITEHGTRGTEGGLRRKYIKRIGDMGKLQKLIKGIRALVRQPYLINRVLQDDGVWVAHVKDKSGAPAALPVLEFSALVGGQDLTLETYSFLDGGSMVTDLLLLKSLAARFEKCRYFEIGTWRGESVANVADVAERCDTLNLSKEEIIGLGLSERYADLHGFFSKGRSNIRHWEGNSRDFDYSQLEGPYDLVFIDGDHSYPMVKSDTEKVFAHLLHKDSIVVWHDYGASPEKIRYEVFAGIWDGVPEEERKYLYQVSNTKCAVYLGPDRLKPVTKEFETPQEPAGSFRVEVQRGPRRNFGGSEEV
jgi:hypothetical protein